MSARLVRRLVVAAFVPFVAAACGARTELRAPLPAPPQPELALGATHSCVLTSERMVHCWGSSGWGEIGVQTTSTSPILVPNIEGATHVSASGQWIDGGDSCAIDHDGTVLCWGANTADYDRLGIHMVGGEDFVAPPRAVSGIGPSRDVRNASSFECALGLDHAVRCFGCIPNIGCTGESPVLISAPMNIVAIAAAGNGPVGSGGGGHACALDTSGAVWCWGDNAIGQLGDGTPLGTSSGSASPVRVKSPIAFAAIAAGGDHTCAIDIAGGAWCWGWNQDGRLGDGTTTDRNVPTPVVGLPQKVTEIRAGGRHTCALLDDASIWCWGGNDKGELGDGDFASPMLLPVEVNGLSDTIEIGLGVEHTCAVERDGSVWCWGSNTSYCPDPCVDPPEYGQLGVSGLWRSATPVRVPL